MWFLAWLVGLAIGFVMGAWTYELALKKAGYSARSVKGKMIVAKTPEMNKALSELIRRVEESWED